MSTQTQVKNETNNSGVAASLLSSNVVKTESERNFVSTGMVDDPSRKYHPYQPIPLPDRTWPDQKITRAPIWCSVDLRDGNQALAIPMSIPEKLEMFDLLVAIGFKQIEVGFPSASQIEFDFIRRLIDENRIPDDVSIQTLVQARPALIERTFEALRGAKNVVFHVYNSINPAQRKIVFNASKDDVKKIAVDAVKVIKKLRPTMGDCNFQLEYSPESFCLTETDFALEVCEAVCDVWQPTVADKIILNIPATVESFTPNIHADQIEWFCRHKKNRETAIISLHTHNDRGTGVAATELALMAGAERVEGTLFGNGERTGNLDIVTVALNMYSQGVHPQLDFSDLPHIREVYERTTRMEVPPRWPYGGELVFTAFSGSHQDAINKGFAAQKADAVWEVPYLPIDPQDMGRTYEAIIRINSQSGKGGVAYVLDHEFGLDLPKSMRVEFGKIINRIADESGGELSNEEIHDAFEREYLQREEPLNLVKFRAISTKDDKVECHAQITWKGESKELRSKGNGPIDAFVLALREAQIADFDIANFNQHSLEGGAEAHAVCYIQIRRDDKSTFYGAAIDTNIELASIKAVVSAVNRALSE